MEVFGTAGVTRNFGVTAYCVGVEVAALLRPRLLMPELTGLKEAIEFECGISKGELLNVGEGELRMFRLFRTGADATCCSGRGSSNGVLDDNNVVRGLRACSGIKVPENDT